VILGSDRSERPHRSVAAGRFTVIMKKVGMVVPSWTTAVGDAGGWAGYGRVPSAPNWREVAQTLDGYVDS
jgi:hypothetical protein